MSSYFRGAVMAAALLAVLLPAVSRAKGPDLPMPLGPRMPVELALNQQEIAVDVSATNAMAAGGGLLGALIVAGVDNARTKSAEERIVPIRDMLVSYAFNQSMERELRAKLAASSGISPEPQIYVVGSEPLPEGVADASGLVPRAFLLMPRYSLDNRFETLTVQITAQVVDRERRSNGKVRLRNTFNRVYAFRFTLPVPAKEPEDNVKAWLAYGPQLMTTMIEEGVRQSTDMLVYDFSEQGRAQWGDFERTAKVDLSTRTYPGSRVKSGDGWVWARTGKGHMQALTGYAVAYGMPKTEAAPVPTGDAASVPASSAADEGAIRENGVAGDGAAPASGSGDGAEKGTMR